MGGIKCALMGSTGMVGQRFIQILDGHPDLELSVMFSSEKRAGCRFGDEVDWVIPGKIPEKIEDMRLRAFDTDLLNDMGIDLVFSALPGDINGDPELKTARSGCKVFSNSALHRGARGSMSDILY